MPDLQELRYPFASALDFFAGGYWSRIEAFHLIFAWACVLTLSVLLLRQKRELAKKLLALYFSLTVFNNNCFLFLGVSCAEIAGILSTLLFLQRVVFQPTLGFRLNRVGTFILGCASVFTVHAVFVGTLYPQLNDFTIAFVRMSLIAKVASLGLCALLFRNSFLELDDLDWLIKQIVTFGTAAILCYIVQVGILTTGHLPFGTYIDAGFIGIPSFGGTSMERGHFGKFLTPLFPMFLLAWLRYRWRIPFILFCIVTLINFSASSLSYFACYSLITVWMFRRTFLQVKVFLGASAAIVAVFLFAFSFQDALAGVALKVIDLGIRGDNSGGRSIELLLNYLRNFPLGISYGGSTLRTGPGLEEIEGGLYPFISQLSILSFPLMFLLLHLELKLARANKRISIPYLKEPMTVGIIALPIIFTADSLWFVPTIWLPLLLSEQLCSAQQSSAITPTIKDQNQVISNWGLA